MEIIKQCIFTLSLRGWRAVDNILGMCSFRWAMPLLLFLLCNWGQHSNLWNPLVSPPRSLLTGLPDILHWFHWFQTTHPHLWKKWETTVGNFHTTTVAVTGSTALTRWNYSISSCYMWWSHLVSISCQITLILIFPHLIYFVLNTGVSKKS